MASKARIASSGAGRSATPLVLAPPSAPGSIGRPSTSTGASPAADRLLEARALGGRGGVQRVDGRRRGARVAGPAARVGRRGRCRWTRHRRRSPCRRRTTCDRPAVRAGSGCGSRCTRRGRPGGWPARPRSPSGSSGRPGCRRRSRERGPGCSRERVPARRARAGGRGRWRSGGAGARSYAGLRRGDRDGAGVPAERTRYLSPSWPAPTLTSAEETPVAHASNVKAAASLRGGGAEAVPQGGVLAQRAQRAGERGGVPGRDRPGRCARGARGRRRRRRRRWWR